MVRCRLDVGSRQAKPHLPVRLADPLNRCGRRVEWRNIGGSHLWPLRRLASFLAAIAGSAAPTEAGNRIRRETVVELASITDQTVVNRRTAIGSGLAALTALVLPGRCEHK